MEPGYLQQRSVREDSVMTQHDIRTAAQSRDAVLSRDSGMAKVTALSWRAGAAGVVAAGLLTVALGHHTAASDVPAGHQRNQGSIQIPAQPPQQAAGSGQVTSGAS
jgi:hypothetical protein